MAFDSEGLNQCVNTQLEDWHERLWDHSGEVIAVAGPVGPVDLEIDGEGKEHIDGLYGLKVATILDKSWLELTDVTPESLQAGFVVSDEGSVSVSDSFSRWALPRVQSEQQPIRLGKIDAIRQFSIDERGLHKGVYIGNEAVADWFSSVYHGYPKYLHPLTSRMLGMEPVMSDVIKASVDERVDIDTRELFKFAVGNKDRLSRIDHVYKSIGKGARYSGGAIEMAPEDHGDANLRTYRDREESGRALRAMSEIRSRILLLQPDPADLHRDVATLLGIDFPDTPGGM